MQLHHMHATFGKLNQASLHLSSGLNVIYGPNESGKSTWCAFLRVMLFGMQPRERGELADKNRYLPLSGAPMSGEITLTADGSRISLSRQTRRPDAPMAAFSACYADTAIPVPSLSPASCGSTLTGVSREVFERTSFVRQCGVAFQSDDNLQRQIATFLANDDSSFISATEALKKQANALRYNRTGAIPHLTSEIDNLRSALTEIENRSRSLSEIRAKLDAIEPELRHLQQQISLHEAADAAAPLQAAQEELTRARAQATACSAAMGELPPKEDLLALQNAAAGAALLQDQLAGTQQPPAPLQPAAPLLRSLLFPLTLIAAALAGFGIGWHLSAPPLLIGSAALFTLAIYLLLRKIISHRKAVLLHKETEEDLHRTAALQNALRAAFETARTDLLQQVRTFCPTASTITHCQRAIETGLASYSALEQAVQNVDTAMARCAEIEVHSAPAAPRPNIPRAALESRLTDLTAQKENLLRAFHTEEGRMQAAGSAEDIQLLLSEKEGQLRQLEQEYEAINLSLAALTAANTSLRQRYAPTLAEKTAKIFAKLTKKKYNKVLLNETLAPAAGREDLAGIWNAPLLSQGTADQLYLALRLALCLTVLPEEKSVPIILDDALVHFDDGRMAQALEVLLELSESRQILLFTCQRREQQWLQQHYPNRFHTVTLSYDICAGAPHGVPAAKR